LNKIIKNVKIGLDVNVGAPRSGFCLNLGHYLESCKLFQLCPNNKGLQLCTCCFCFPNSLLMHVASWFIEFLMIMINLKTLDVDFCVVEVGITFLYFETFWHCCDFDFVKLRWTKPFDWFWVLATNLLEFNGICAITTNVEFVQLRWKEPFLSFRVRDTIPWTLMTFVQKQHILIMCNLGELKTHIEFYISSF
jgi:hypothetical protein